MPTTEITVPNSDTLNKQLQLAGSATESDEYKQALQFLKQPVLLDAMEKALDDKELREFAVKHPEQFLLKNNIELPVGLDIEFSVPQQKSKPIPIPENFWFELQMSNCRRFMYFDKKKKQFVQETVCFEIKVIGKIPLPSPII